MDDLDTGGAAFKGLEAAGVGIGLDDGRDGLGAVAALGELVTGPMPDGILRSLISDGIFAGVGGVLVFLPQILILFFFILVLEESGYLPRAAFLLDRLMFKAGLTGRAFIPLLSSTVSITFTLFVSLSADIY